MIYRYKKSTYFFYRSLVYIGGAGLWIFFLSIMAVILLCFGVVLSRTTVYEYSYVFLILARIMYVSAVVGVPSFLIGLWKTEIN